MQRIPQLQRRDVAALEVGRFATFRKDVRRISASQHQKKSNGTEQFGLERVLDIGHWELKVRVFRSRK